MLDVTVTDPAMAPPVEKPVPAQEEVLDEDQVRDTDVPKLTEASAAILSVPEGAATREAAGIALMAE